jgi:hypothetical protein
MYPRLTLVSLILLAAGLAACNPGEAPTATQMATRIPPPADTVAPTPSAAPSPTADPYLGWQTFSDAEVGFAFRFPPDATLVSTAPDLSRIDLTLVPGTNLSEKYLEVAVDPDPAACQVPPGGSTDPASVPAEPVTINGLDFIRHTFIGAAAGNRYDATSYSIVLNGRCVRMGFVLHSAVAENFPTPPPEYDRAAEAAVFDQIMSTFGLTAG